MWKVSRFVVGENFLLFNNNCLFVDLSRAQNLVLSDNCLVWSVIFSLVVLGILVLLVLLAVL